MAYSSILHIVSPQKKKKNVLGWLPGWVPTYLLGWNLYAEGNLLSWKSWSILPFVSRKKTAETSRTITIPCSYSWNPSKGPYSIPICLNKYFCLYPCILIEIILGSYYSFTLPHDAKQQVENEINLASISLRNW